MRILVIGAGATGGYFGGRLLESGQDVTFLVRAARAAQLAAQGLVIRSSHGNTTLPSPATVQAGALHDTFDLVLLSCKAYHLPQVIEDMAPAVGPHTMIVPLLNGMRHLDVLDERFGKERVLGGQCVIAATLDKQGVVHHLNQSHSLTFGERSGERSERAESVLASMSQARFEARLSTTILQDMWDKWVFLASLAGITCLMRAPVGDIMAATGGEAATLQLLEDCRRVAALNQHAPADTVLARACSVLTEKDSKLSASMMRDLEQGGQIEADHVIGDMLARAGADAESLTMLRTAYAHLKAYEARRDGGR
ncbi:MAG TPA: 2-dehydropantoate 2-reductase [Dyella sp.]|uniref:2-dehydropantoate 2-reductase n=1 Tax=Dyella sp. TaxID=1869338 RepID=UPI002D7A1ACE|nr:2-dehydropantoate 2-reductase [Dyella sp.]HET6553209.1 2-dehydropantoate 2-reductase [Dyella sp.]